MGRCAITAYRIEALTSEFVDGYAAEDGLLGTAREQARELGVVPVTPASGAALRLLATVLNAKAVVEVGTGTGVSGLWLLRGMRTDGILTTIDVEAEHQRVAKGVFAAAGFAPSRTRVITGRAAAVLPRLADAAYDLVFVHHDGTEYADAVSSAARLLHTRGMLVVGGALAGGRVPDPAARDLDTVAVRQVVNALREADEWTPALLPTPDGLLCAVRQ